MGRYQEAVRGQFQNNFQEITGIQPQDGPPVRLYIPYPGQTAVYPGSRLKVGNIDDIMYFSDLAVPFID